MINLAQRDIAHSLGKFIVTALGVGMLIGVVLIMIGVYRGWKIRGLWIARHIASCLVGKKLNVSCS